MTNPLRDLIEEAADNIDRFKHPDVDEAQKRLDEILKAADIGGILHDEITRIRFYRGRCCISTRYSVRCCEQTASFEFPETILDAVDPIAAACRWGLEKKRTKAASEVAEAERMLDCRRKHLAEIEAAASALTAEVA